MACVCLVFVCGEFATFPAIVFLKSKKNKKNKKIPHRAGRVEWASQSAVSHERRRRRMRRKSARRTGEGAFGRRARCHVETQAP